MIRGLANCRWPSLIGLMLCGVLGFTSIARGQSSSLLGDPHERQALGLATHSWCFIDVPPIKDIQLNDIVTVIVDEKSQVISEGEVERRKRASLQATLANWIWFDGLDLKPAPQSSGDPKIDASMQNQYRAEAELETRDGMKFRIAAVVVDIRPNGNLVLEAHYSVKNNSESWQRALTGTVRREDVLPNNTVLSEDIADLRIQKIEHGHVRDGYRRGWLLKWLDKYQMF